MTDDDRPSIAELQSAMECVAEGCRTDARDRVLDAAPVLLEIAAAVLDWKYTLGAPRGDRRADAAEQALQEAIAKVRP